MNGDNLNPEIKVIVHSDDVNKNGATQNSEKEEQPLMTIEQNPEDERNYLNLLKLKEELESGSKKTSRCGQLCDRLHQKPSKPKELRLVICVAILFLIILVGLAVIFRFYQEDLYYVYKRQGFSVDGKTMHITFKDKNGEEKLRGNLWQTRFSSKLPLDCTTPDLKNAGGLCLEWFNNMRVNIKPKIVSEIELTCNDITWNPIYSKIRSGDSREMADCYVMNKNEQWFGLGLLDGIGWPLQTLSVHKQPYVTSGPFSLESAFGSALEPYVLSSSGASISIVSQSPLQISILESDKAFDKQICFYVTEEIIDRTNTSEGLKYTVCTSTNLTQAHTGSFSILMNQIAAVPTLERPTYDVALMEHPVWSTLEYLGSNIDEGVLEKFTSDIQNSESIFGSRDLFLMDEGWELDNGDFKFNESRFANSKAFISKTKKMGFRVGLWVHPMAATTSEIFRKDCQTDIFVEGEDAGIPRLFLWWNGPRDLRFRLPLSSIISFPFSKHNYLERTRSLKRTLELDILQHCYGYSENFPSKRTVPNFNYSDDYISKQIVFNPNQHTSDYAKAAEPKSIVDSVYKNQLDPVVLRLTGAVSKWSGANSIKSIISDALSLGLIGYPLFVPQAVGGSDYSLLGGRLTKELYIRWMEVSVFMPILHLSTPPDAFDNETVEIVTKLMNLRRSVILPELRRVAALLTLGSGLTLIKPLWMISNDSEAVACHDEFIVGDKILVAPILEESTNNRNVYIPEGMWEDCSTEEIHVGPKWLQGYIAELNTVPYFVKKN